VGWPVYLPETINRYGRINESRIGPDGYTLYFSSQFIVSAMYPKDDTAARKGLADMEHWNNGSDNIWRIDIRPYLQHRD
jgi:hypothetical protein